MTSLAINGFGRIGRLALRAVIEKHPDVSVVAINDLVPAQTLAYLLKYDTVHGRLPFDVRVEGDELVVAERRIKVYAERDPEKLPWAAHDVDFVIESTGLFTTKDKAKAHIRAGAKRVIVSAPAKGGVPTFVVGVNEDDFNAESDFVVSNASCTTNCLAPLTKVLLENFGIEEGLMTTIHAMTATQATVDSPCAKSPRLGRAAAHNLIPSTTGAAQAVALCLPQVEGKLTGMAFRVPTLDVSAVDLTVRLAKDTSYEEICAAVKKAAEGKMKGIIEYCDEEVVSSDFIGSTYSCVFDSRAGIALNARFFKLIAWYDNEIGYAHRIIDLAQKMSKKIK